MESGLFGEFIHTACECKHKGLSLVLLNSLEKRVPEGHSKGKPLNEFNKEIDLALPLFSQYYCILLTPNNFN